MAQNLFEKYGIKEVADVTFFRIEKKEETYEAQREIKVSSILKGAIELRDVYPLTEYAIGDEDGFKAYVVKDVDLIQGTNYDCDDVRQVKEVYTIVFDTKDRKLETFPKEGHKTLDKAYLIFNDLSTDSEDDDIEIDTEKRKVVSISKKQYDPQTGLELTETELEGYEFYENPGKDVAYTNTENTPAVHLIKKYDHFDDEDADEEGIATDFVGQYNATYVVFTVYKNDKEMETGIYKMSTPSTDSKNTTPDLDKIPGTHEYTYAEQICMSFATNQNLISKTGTRYQFTDADTLFGDLTFDDHFAVAPSSSERIVVVGMPGSMTEGTYDTTEVLDKINELTDTYKAKAYDVVYNDYAELVVEDEMGYYNPAFLGTNYKRVHGIGSIEFFKPSVRSDAFVVTRPDSVGEIEYQEWAKERKGVDIAISLADMWDEGVHYSINDAIDALRQKQKVLDAGVTDKLSGIKSIYGGYKVSWLSSSDAVELAVNPGGDDVHDNKKRDYDFSVDGKKIDDITSKYPLEDVTNAVTTIGLLDKAIDKDLRVDMEANDRRSNRAIYVRVDGAVDTSAGAFIYLLHNRNYRRLAADIEGIFEFEDKKGNTLYYQDKIFCGVEWLALVVIGNKGLIFVVNRHGKSDTKSIAWMINESGYVTNSQAKRLAANGLIHTTDITANNETFQATCTVKSLAVHKTTKQTNRYVPVLFLDTLKVSTIEQTAEEVYATGGKGDANLIGWDYGKSITLTLQDALFTPASMSLMFGSYEGNDFREGVNSAKEIDRFEKCFAKRNFIVPAGNKDGTPTEANHTAQAVYYDPRTMEPYQDGTPITEGEMYYKYTRSIAYEGQSIGKVIEISADKFPGTYRVVGDTYIRMKENGTDERFQFIIPQCKMSSEQTITLEAEGDPSVDIISNADVKIA